MADDTNTAEREAFEAHCLRTGHSSTSLGKWGEKDDVPTSMRGDYIMRNIQNAWLAFQAGRASLAASAGSEPVAAYALRNLIANGSLTQAKAITALVLTAETTHPSPPEGMAGWKPIAEAPKTGHTLLLGYFNSANKWRTTRGQWMSQDYIDEYAKDPDFMEPGWHETTVEDDDGKCWPIEPTHWMPLPAPPLPASEAKEL